MKTKLFSLLAAGALLISISAPLFAENNSTKKTAKEITNEAIKATQDINEYVESRLDDTLFMDVTPVDNGQEDNEILDYYNEQHQREYEFFNRGFDFVKKIGLGFVIFILLLITITIIGEYLKRRQKYKIIEKAIENNYPLPPGFLGKDVRPTTIQHVHYTQGEISGKRVKNVIEYKQNDWANYRSGIKWFAWGFSFMLFFIIVDAPIWVFALIPLIIGIGKLYAAYKIQKAVDDANTYSQEEDKEMPTPPPFNNDDANSNNK